MGVNGIYGLSGSGIDVESMVKVGMMSKQNQYDKMQAKLTTNQWKKEAFNDVYNTLSTFNYGSLSSYKMQSTMNAMGATSSNQSAVSVTANGAAASMAHNVEVKSLASNAYLLTADKVGRNNTSAETASSIKLSDVFNTSGMSSGDKLEFTISDGKNEATVSFSYDEIVNDGQTLYDLASKINGAKTSTGDKLNITASYDSTNDAFALYNNEGGSDNKIMLKATSDKSADLLNKLGLSKVTTDSETGESSLTALGSFTNDGEAQGAEGGDGEVVIDGKTYKSSNNRVSASNVTYTLNGVGKASVNVTQDTDSIIDKVKSFVDDYNKILDDLYAKYTEKQYSDYKPLTESQKEGMTEDQIKKWEEKAKSGLLTRDQTISKIISQMREALSTPVDGINGKYNSAYALGIDTTKTNGHISLDEDKLKKALAAEPDSVYKVFGTLPEADKNGNYDFNKSGVAQRLGDVMVDAMKSVKSEAGESSSADDDSRLGNLMRELQTKMSNFKTQMNTFQTLLYKKYDNMESMLAQLGTQMNFLFGQSS